MIEYLPYAGIATGAAVGVATEIMARRHVIAGDEPRVSRWAEAGRMNEVEEVGRIRQIANFVGAAAVVPALMAAGGFVGTAFQPEGADSPQVGLSIVLEHTSVAGKDPEVLDTMNELATTFDTDEVNARVIVAGRNEVKPLPVDKVVADQPWGDADFDEALVVALGEDTRIKSESTNPDIKTSVLFITKGHAPASLDAQIQAAKASGVKLDVANVVGKDNKQSGDVDGLKKLAKETGGIYKEVNADNVDEMQDAVVSKLQGTDKKTDSGSKLPQRILSSLLFISTAYSAYRNRKDQPLRRAAGKRED